MTDVFLNYKRLNVCEHTVKMRVFEKCLQVGCETGTYFLFSIIWFYFFMIKKVKRLICSLKLPWEPHWSTNFWQIFPIITYLLYGTTPLEELRPASNEGFFSNSILVTLIFY